MSLSILYRSYNGFILLLGLQSLARLSKAGHPRGFLNLWSGICSGGAYATHIISPDSDFGLAAEPEGGDLISVEHLMAVVRHPESLDACGRRRVSVR